MSPKKHNGTPWPTERILFFRMNLLHVPNVEMSRRVRSRSVHDFGTCKENAAGRGWEQTNFVELWSVSRPRLAEMAIEIWVMSQLTEKIFETSLVHPPW